MKGQSAPGLFVNERSHAAFHIRCAGLLVGFEIEPSAHQDAKESVRLIKTMPAEHRLGAHFRQGSELVQDKLFERLIRHAAGECRTHSRKSNPVSAVTMEGRFRQTSPGVRAPPSRDAECRRT